MSGAARPRCRRPPNTISAAPISPRAAALRPSTPSSPMPTMDSQRGVAAVSRWIASGSGMTAIPGTILILGGTTEARMLAERLASRLDLDVTLSLAGRTASPARAAGAGAHRRFWRRCRACRLSLARADRRADRRHASLCGRHLGECRRRRGASPACRFIALRRPPWVAAAGDRWTEVNNVSEAVRSAR